MSAGIDIDEELSGPNQTFSRSIDRLKESFLLATAQGGNAEDCEALLSIGADVNWRGAADETPLLAACKKGHSAAAQVILAYGADCNARGADSFTALHIAARRGDLGTINLLLNNGANMNLKTADGKTAFDIAKAKGFEDVCQRIIMHRHSTSHVAQVPVTAERKAGAPASASASASASAAGGTPRRPPSASAQRAEQKAPAGDSSVTMDMEAAAKQAEAEQLRPSSKAQDKRDIGSGVGATALPQRGAGPTVVAAPKDYSFAPSIAAAMTGSVSGAAASRPAPGGPLARTGVDQTNYIYELQASLDAKSSEAEVLRVQLEEELISGHVAEKENVALKEALLDLKEQVLEAQEELALLRGDPEGLRELTTVGECDKVERYLKASLARVEVHKLALINKMVADNMSGMEDTRLCVVCQSNEKSVVLLPCRHVCLCKECANNDNIVDCPLCRERIRDRIAVFM